MAGCGGRRPNMEEEADGRSVEMPPVPAAHQGPESSDDHSDAHPTESPEHSPEKNRWDGRTFFTEVQLNTLKASFNEEHYPTSIEMTRLINKLSLPERTIQTWFQNRRNRERNRKKFAYQGPESSDDPSDAHPTESPEHSPEKNRWDGRTFFTEVQLNTLKASFNEEHYPTSMEMKRLINKLSLPERTIQTWFQNRRNRERNRKKFAHQGPESSDDPSDAHPTESPEHSPEKNRWDGRTFFTEVQLNTLKASFNEEHYPTSMEMKRLINKLSLPERTIQTWFQNRRNRERNRKKFAYQRPESSDDHSDTHPKESPEHSPEKNRGCVKTFFTEVQLNTLKASFNEEHYPTSMEMKRLINKLSLPERTIQTWFQNRRNRERNRKTFAPQSPESSDDRSAGPHKESPESSDDRSAGPHKESTEYSPEKNQGGVRTVFTKEQLNALEASFKKSTFPSTTERGKLAKQLFLEEQTITNWFVNRRREARNQEKPVRKGSESFDDPSAAHPTKDPEYSQENIEVCEETVFTEEQLNNLETLFKKNLYLSITEREQLENQLSLPPHSIQRWFEKQSTNVKPLPESKYQLHTRSNTSTEDQLDFLHKQSMDGRINVVQAQHLSYLDSFPPSQPVDSSALPQGPHSTDMVYCPNVVGPPDSCSLAEVSNILPESGHELPNDYLLNVSLPNKIIEPGTSVSTPEASVTNNPTSYDGPSTSSAPNIFLMPITQDNLNLPRIIIWPPESSITTDSTSYDGQSTSSASSTSHVPIAPYNFNLPETRAWTPESSITTDPMSYEELSISPEPSTPQMPIAWYNADEGSSTVTTPLIHDESTDSD